MKDKIQETVNGLLDKDSLVAPVAAMANDAVTQLKAVASDPSKNPLVVVKEDLEKNIKALVAESISKMDVVSKEEFDRQNQLLQQTNKQLSLLQQQLQDIEEKIFQAQK